MKKKIDKDNSRKKIIKKEKKTMWGNTIAIHSVLKKKLQSQILNQLNIKKIKSTKTILKKTTQKNEKKRKTNLEEKKKEKRK